MLENAIHFIGEHSDRLAVLSAALGLAALTFSSVNLIRLFSAYRKLMRQLFVKEKALNADLSDVNDRELRKIANYLSKFRKDDGIGKLDEGIQSKVDQDFIVFCYAFEDLSETSKDSILSNLNVENSQDKVRALRRIIFHSHYNRHPLDLHFLIPSIGREDSTSVASRKFASAECAEETG